MYRVVVIRALIDGPINDAERSMLRGISLNMATGDARQIVEAARLAEQVGFESVWCYDHLSGSVFDGDGSLDVWSILAAIAMATEDVAIGPLVVNVTTRHPAHIALAAATLQSLSGGRLQLGLGAGSSRPSPFAAEMDMFGFVQDGAERRRARVIEAIGFLRALWRGSSSFEGEWASFQAVSGMSVPRPQCPIHVGANGPKMAALAGSHADGVNFHSWEPDLAGLIEVALRASSERGEAPLVVSVEGPWQRDWLELNSPTLRGLSDLGVSEVMLRWNSELGLDAIRGAARWLA